MSFSFGDCQSLCQAAVASEDLADCLSRFCSNPKLMSSSKSNTARIPSTPSMPSSSSSLSSLPSPSSSLDILDIDDRDLDLLEEIYNTYNRPGNKPVSPVIAR